MTDGDTQRLRATAASRGFSLHVEGVHDEAEAADRDTATARPMLERAVSSGRPSVEERARQLLAEIDG